MSFDNIDARVKAKLERKMAQLAERLTEIGDDTALREGQATIAEELAQVDAEVDALDAQDEVAPGVRERLEARRERLLSRQEHLDLKLELLAERRERLQERLEELRTRAQEARADAVSRARESATRARTQARRKTVSAKPTRKQEEERRKILEMLSQGTINAEEAGRLLDALRAQEQTSRHPGHRPRWVRIRVTDMASQAVRVNLTLPVGLVRAGLRAGGSIAGVAGLDTTDLEGMLDRGEVGHILDYQDPDDGERVEIFVE